MNSVFLIGRLVKDVELKKMAGTDTYIANFTLAVSRNKSKEADFFRVVVYGKFAEICSQYLAKGKLVCVQGRLKTGSYEKEGRKVYTVDVVADNVQFLEPKESKKESPKANEDIFVDLSVSREDIEDRYVLEKEEKWEEEDLQ